jgi:CTD kinase subunit beta
LLFPPHAIAVASLYLAAKLDCFEGLSTLISNENRTSQEIAEILETMGDWEKKFHVELADLEG